MSIALVTGAGRRVGQVLALALAQQGHDVVVHHHHSAAGAFATAQTIEAMGRKAWAIRADLADQAQVDALIPDLVAEIGTIDHLVLSAATFERDRLSDLEPARFERQLAVNLKAQAFLAKAFAAQARPGASLTTILDTKVAAPDPDFLSYGLSKIALEGLTRMLALELAPNIRVNGLAPGLTLISGAQTPDSYARAQAATPLRRSNDLDDLGAALIYLINAQAVTGQILRVDGGRHLDGPYGRTP